MIRSNDRSIVPGNQRWMMMVCNVDVDDNNDDDDDDDDHGAKPGDDMLLLLQTATSAFATCTFTTF